jgi:hypothetical protein
MQTDWLTHFAIDSVQTQSTSSSIRTHPKTRGGANLKVLASGGIIDFCDVFFFFFVSFFLCIVCLHKYCCVLLLV